MILAKYLEVFCKKSNKRQKAYFHIKMETSFATSEFYGNAVYIIFVSMHLFLNKMVYKKECKQFVIWSVILLAPGGRVGVTS